MSDGCTQRHDDQDRQRDRQLIVDDQTGDEDAMQAGGEPDRQVELADRHRQGQPAGDDHRQGGLIEHVGEVGQGRERARRQQRERQDHRHKADNRSVPREHAEGGFGTWAETRVADGDVGHLVTCALVACS
jgi:hypothetical protein